MYMTVIVGGKGVVGKIIPDNEMPSIATLNDGEAIRNDSKVSFKADIVANPLGKYYAQYKSI